MNSSGLLTSQKSFFLYCLMCQNDKKNDKIPILVTKRGQNGIWTSDPNPRPQTVYEHIHHFSLKVIETSKSWGVGGNPNPSPCGFWSDNLTALFVVCSMKKVYDFSVVLCMMRKNEKISFYIAKRGENQMKILDSEFLRVNSCESHRQLPYFTSKNSFPVLFCT